MALLAGSIFAQTTEFTYQGRLIIASAPATSNYDFEFDLFDAVSGGVQVGSTLTRSSVTVANGDFSVKLDFGDQFPSANRFLEIRVRLTGGGGAFTPLSPRQQITSAPYAIRSLNAGTATNATTAVDFTGTLAGDVTGTQAATTIAPNAVTTAKIADANVTSAKLANGSVTDAKIVDVAGSKVTGTLTVATIPAGSNHYIQNSSTNDQTANFTINGMGIANIFNARTYFLIAGSRVLWTPGTNNLFAGVNAGAANTTGTSSSFFGYNAGTANTTAGSNSFFGSEAGRSTTTGGGNAFFGKDAGRANTTGFSNSFFGTSAGFSNTTGDSNAFFGRNAGFANTSGISNAFFGWNSGGLNTIGLANSFFGYNSGGANSTGTGNSFFGTYTGQSNTEGYDNAFFGIFAGASNTTGFSNSFFGRDAGYANSTGTNNVFIGRLAGFANTLGNSNTIIGDSADVDSSNLTFATAVGAEAIVTTSNRVQLGRDTFDTVRVGKLAAASATNLCITSDNVLAACSSSRRFKENIQSLHSSLNLLQSLRPVTFDWKNRKESDLGLIAEEVADVEPLLVTHDRNGEIQGVKYDRVSVVLVNAIQEQQRQIETQQKQIEAQQKQIEQQRKQLESLTKFICAINSKADVCQK